jgi:hypothetical protein
MKKAIMTLMAAMFLSAPLLVIAAETATPVPAKVLPRSAKKKKHKLSKKEEEARATALRIKAANARRSPLSEAEKKEATKIARP